VIEQLPPVGAQLTAFGFRLRPPFPTIAIVLLAFAAAAVLVRTLHVLLGRMINQLDAVDAESRAAVHARAQQLTRAMTLAAYGLAALASVSFALQRFGLSEPRWRPRQVVGWLGTHGLNIVIIVAGSFVVLRAASLAIDHLQFRLRRRHDAADPEWRRRAATLSGILSSLVTATVLFVAALMILRELAIDIVPILTGAGIAGLAIGFGAQNLVRDVISGFFLILEDQVRVGDWVRINGIGGTVEEMNLRTIVLRDPEGAVQVFPNGTVTSLANVSKVYAYAVVDVQIVYAENYDRVAGTMREIGAAMQTDPVWTPLLLAPIEVLGIVSLDGGAATVRVRIKTPPLDQWRVANELRRRVMTMFVKRGIRPFVQ
jgi:small conductance mechanosensitive channel